MDHLSAVAYEADVMMVLMEYGVDKFVDTGWTPTGTRRDRGFHARGGRRHVGHCLLHCLVGKLSDGSPLINTRRSGVCCVDLEPQVIGGTPENRYGSPTYRYLSAKRSS